MGGKYLLWKRRSGALLLTLACALPAGAVDENNQFRSIGIGAQPCGDYTQARDGGNPEDWGAYGVWMTGFITANNLMRRDTYDLLGDTSAEHAMTVLDQYCAGNPQHPFVFAVMQLVSEELMPQRVRSKPDTAPAPIPIPAPADTEQPPER